MNYSSSWLTFLWCSYNPFCVKNSKTSWEILICLFGSESTRAVISLNDHNTETPWHFALVSAQPHLTAWYRCRITSAVRNFYRNFIVLNPYDSQAPLMIRIHITRLQLLWNVLLYYFKWIPDGRIVPRSNTSGACFHKSRKQTVNSNQRFWGWCSSGVISKARSSISQGRRFVRSLRQLKFWWHGDVSVCSSYVSLHEVLNSFAYIWAVQKSAH